MRATFRNLVDMLNVAAFMRNRHEHAVSVVRWALILLPMAALVGTLCAAFLLSLDTVTQGAGRRSGAQCDTVRDTYTPHSTSRAKPRVVS